MKAEIIINGRPVPFPSATPNTSPDTDGEPPRFIIMHSTGGAFAGAVSWMLQKISRVSAHFCVSRTGEIRQLASVNRIAWHAGKSHWGNRSNLNACSLGIEMEHIDNTQDWPAAQINAVVDLAAALCVRFGIPRINILKHSDIAPGRKIDPALFDLTTFRTRVDAAVRRMKGKE